MAAIHRAIDDQAAADTTADRLEGKVEQRLQLGFDTRHIPIKVVYEQSELKA